MRFLRHLLVAAVAAALPAAVQADWREDLKVLRIGFLSTNSPAADIARMEPFRAYLEARIGVPVELIPATTYRSLIDAEVSGRVPYAIHSATSFATAAALCDCVEPLAAPVAPDGSRGFYAVLVVRGDSAAQTLADLKGARLALSADDSIAGRLVPLKAFAAEGIDAATHFSTLFESPGPEAAIGAVLDGRADAAVGWSSLAGDAVSGYSFGVLRSMVSAGKLAMGQIRIIWQSQLIPFGPHAVRKDLPGELKPLLVEALAALAAEAPDVLDAVDRSAFGGGGFAPVSAGDYAVISELVKPP
jgi:phosphonate transport system substrate-binding protein